MKLEAATNLTALRTFLERRGRLTLLFLVALAMIITLSRAWHLTLDQPLSTELITAQELQPDRTGFQALQDSINQARTRAGESLPTLRNPFTRP